MATLSYRGAVPATDRMGQPDGRLPDRHELGSRIEFSLVGDHVEMRVRSSPAGEARSGFGMLKSRRAAVPTDFDPATLLKR